MTVDTRDELIERMNARVGNHPELRWAMEAALSVVETATSTCDDPRCEDGWIYRRATNVQDAYREACASCGGQPGPLLVLQVLGGELDHTDPMAEFWGFPRRQDGPPT